MYKRLVSSAGAVPRARASAVDPMHADSAAVFASNDGRDITSRSWCVAGSSNPFSFRSGPDHDVVDIQAALTHSGHQSVYGVLVVVRWVKSTVALMHRLLELEADLGSGKVLVERLNSQSDITLLDI